MELLLTCRKRNDFPFNLDLEPQDMPVGTLAKAVDFSTEDKEEMLTLMGNEPALYPELERLISLAEKRGKALRIETSGLMPASARKLLIEHHVVILFRVYQPKYYQEGDIAEAKETLKAFMDAQLPVTFLLMADDPKADYNFVMEWIKEFKLPALAIRTDCRIDSREWGTFLNATTQMVKDLILNGGNAIYDCYPAPCGFSDESFGILAKLAVKRHPCVPHLVVMPDGHMAHCRAMTIVPGPELSTFKDFQDLLKYYYDVFRQMQVNVEDNSVCATCAIRALKLCTGHNMAAKATALLEDRKKMEPLIANPEGISEEEQFKNIWRMAVDSIKLGMHDAAIECLEEMRRIKPENPDFHFWLGYEYWEAGRHGEAEEEFRKCSRLSKNHVPALFELHHRLVQNGNTIRARMLLEEIKKLAAQQQAEN